ncbi:hypothetical protein K470DRAFT_10766 [Piedraia hortae CBS 480.64]|uniref:Transcription factor Iwr1 domain-containing protein n=1 Tax=Piedraia hortae CBS 480.64 TaxID=1314780 RepID=A0A6A7C639_9PEZI|nr:hypothetical protein K470DRAFT_10766 [Piedraia hortae CBS 480.64]
MMAPQVLCIKRKATDSPVPHLLVKKQRITTNQTPTCYVLQLPGQVLTQRNVAGEFSAAASQQPRQFSMMRSKKRSFSPDDMITFAEKKPEPEEDPMQGVQQTLPDMPPPGPENRAQTFKRPGKGARIIRQAGSPNWTPSGPSPDELASILQDLGIDTQTQEKPLAKRPVLSTDRYKAYRQQKAEEQRAKEEKLASAKTVYDTYNLVTSPAEIAAFGNHTDVGHLIIGDDDEEIWDENTYFFEIEEEPANEDDIDAENWHTNQYPDSEISSEDEHHRGHAYELDRDELDVDPQGGSEPEDFDSDETDSG